MSECTTFAAVSRLMAALATTPPDERLPALKRAVLAHGGRWDLPSELTGTYRPALVSLQVFGVHAMAASLDELPRNWMRAARNVLEAEGQGAMQGDEL
jgi:hypothetical protein